MRRRIHVSLLVAVLACAMTVGAERAEADDLTVFAAASLTEAFQEIARLFTAEHPETKTVFNFAGSQQLAGQIIEAAPADVFASANAEQMNRVSEAGLVSGSPKQFATTHLAIAVEPGNPQKISGLADLARRDLVIVLAAEEVPAGRYAREALEKAGVSATPASFEIDVRSVLAKIAIGEADAGIVYQSDIVAAARKVAAVDIPARHNVTATYPIAVLAKAPNAAAATEFVTFVLSDAGRAVLSRFGFGPPGPKNPAPTSVGRPED
jgi:molybdate transport system substrate-binding protein